jgi:arylsulfatase A-like enzyme
MNAINDVFDHLAPLPYLPVISALALAVGAVLMCARRTRWLIAHWSRHHTFRNSGRQDFRKAGFLFPSSTNAARKSREGTPASFLTFVWFGLLAGGLELMMTLVHRALNPHVSLDALRTNRHFLWMIPVADLVIFAAAGLTLALLKRFQGGLARWVSWRLPVGLLFANLLLTVEGLQVTAAFSLAGGLAATIGPALEARAGARFGRFVAASSFVMGLGLLVLTGVSYDKVVFAERSVLAELPPAKPGAPNVLLIVLDTVRAASLSLYGHNRPTTPNLERLARTGFVFSEARSTAPWTLPSHASMMTGRWPHELSVGWDLPLDGTFPTLAETLQNQGYATAGFVGNVYYCNALYGLDRGFARYEDAYENQTVSLFEIVRSSGLGKQIVRALGYPIRLSDGETSLRKTAGMIDRDVLGWLGKKPSGRPFFVFVNYYDAHRPHVLEGDRSKRFGIAALPCPEQYEIDKRFLDLAGKTVPADVEHQRIVNEGFQRYHDRYDTSIAFLDRHVGQLVDEIKRRGLLDNTLVIVTSDHGEQLGEHGVIAHGASLYRPEMHVPLLIIAPGGSASAKVVSEPVSLRDIPATVAEYVGLGAQHPFPGASLTRLLHNAEPAAPEAQSILSEVEHNEVLPRSPQIPSSLGPAVSLVSSDRVYIRSAGGREELYDRVHDPLESVDLAKYPQYRPEIDRFRKELNRAWTGAVEAGR